jgi:hypothetical protein
METARALGPRLRECSENPPDQGPDDGHDVFRRGLMQAAGASTDLQA